MNAKRWIAGALIALLAGCAIGAFVWRTDIDTQQLSAVLPDGRVLTLVKTATAGNEVRLIGTDGSLLDSAPTDVTVSAPIAMYLVQSNGDHAIWFDQLNRTIIRISVADLSVAKTDTVPMPANTNLPTSLAQARPLPDGGVVMLRNYEHIDYTTFPIQITNYRAQLVHVGPDGVIIQSQTFTDPAQADLLRVTADQVDISADTPQSASVTAVVHLDGTFNELSRLTLPAGSNRVLEDGNDHLWVRLTQSDGSNGWQILDGDGNLLATPVIGCDGKKSLFTQDNHLVLAGAQVLLDGSATACVGQYGTDGQPVYEKSFSFSKPILGAAVTPYVDDQDNLALVTNVTKGPVVVGLVNTCVMSETDINVKVHFFDASGAQQGQAAFATRRSRQGWDPASQSLCGSSSTTTGVYDLVAARLLGPGQMVAVAHRTGGTNPTDFATLIRTVKP